MSAFMAEQQLGWAEAIALACVLVVVYALSRLL